MTTVVSLTRDQREVLARKLGIADPDALTPEDILKLPRPRSFAEDDLDERAYLEMLGIEPREREYGEVLSKSEREYPRGRHAGSR